MDATSLIGNAQDAYALGLQKQAAAGAAVLKASGARTPKTNTQMDPQRARDAAKQFEGFFVGQMMEHMMAGVEVNPEFGGGTGEETWRSMLNQEYGKEIAKSGKLGIADNVMKAMLQAQEQRTSAAAAPQAAANIDAMEVTSDGNAAAAAAVIAPSRR